MAQALINRNLNAASQRLAAFAFDQRIRIPRPKDPSLEAGDCMLVPIELPDAIADDLLTSLLRLAPSDAESLV